MKRGALQLWTLGVWFVGLLTMQVILLVAGFFVGVDSFVIKGTDVDWFEKSFAPTEGDVNAVKEEGKRMIRMLASDRIASRTVEQFKTFLAGKLPSQAHILLGELADKCRENRAFGLQMTFFQIYLPWLAVMIAGLLANTSHRRVALSKARASIFLSVGLQILFVVFLVNTFLMGDLAATRNVELMATLITALVGTLVQFVFPAAPEVQTPVVAPVDKGPEP